jgi:hypothetical protein
MAGGKAAVEARPVKAGLLRDSARIGDVGLCEVKLLPVQACFVTDALSVLALFARFDFPLQIALD